MRRRDFFATAAAAALALPASAAARKTRHIVLFTCDGVRWQDLFTGMDASLMNEKAAGMGQGAGDLRSRFSRPTAQERRSALMPFFWNTLVPRGVLLGNLSKGSSMQVSNRYRVSYPGYSEILTGRAQDEVIKGNDPIRNPTPSFLQVLKEHSHLRSEQVAVFDPLRHDWYREGTRHYKNDYGSKQQYANAYRQAFREGYDRGYRELGYVR